jgi:hypothetical protein
MTSPDDANLKECALSLWVKSVLIFCVAGLTSPLLAADTLDVKRDPEKTVYSIGSSREDRNDQDRAWDMLRNMGIIVDQRPNVPPQNQPNQPPKSK